MWRKLRARDESHGQRSRVGCSWCEGAAEAVLRELKALPGGNGIELGLES